MSNNPPVLSAQRLRLVLVPAIISLAVTLLRLWGERLHWSERWFSTETGGTVPSRVSWVIGITWLAIPFGVYFALKLDAAGERPRGAWRAVGLGVLGIVVWYLGGRYLFEVLPVGFPSILLFIWALMLIAAFPQWVAWRGLFKTLLCYGLLSRIPVVIVMFLAMRSGWGTHYDYAGAPAQFQMPFWPRFLWLAFFPQLVFWVGFTIVSGSLAGSLTIAFKHQYLRAFRDPNRTR